MFRDLTSCLWKPLCSKSKNICQAKVREAFEKRKNVIKSEAENCQTASHAPQEVVAD